MEERFVNRQVTFTIEGEPVAKERPRFCRKTGRTYTPKKTQDFEKFVGWCAAQQMRGISIMTGEIACRLTFWVCGTTKDCDNMVKAVLDGLNGVAWVDDSQVKSMAASIQPCDGNARIEVTITEYAA